MSSKICIHSSVVHFPYIETIAKGIAVFHDTEKYPDFLGHHGYFEQNPQAMDSQLNKLHIALYRSDWTLKTWKNRNGYNRTCDNMVIYVQHFFQSNYYQILAIVTPEAHKNIDKLLPTYIQLAEEFHTLRPYELSQLPTFTNDCNLPKPIKLTPQR